MGPLQTYQDMLARGEIEPDAAQADAVRRLQMLAVKLRNYSDDVAEALSGWRALLRRERPEAPQGIYFVGKVGRGKTMLMDIFYESLDLPQKHRVHFHAFMDDVHERIAAARKDHDGDPIRPVAEELARDMLLICFDEFAIEDIADAMIIGRLFEKLFEAGVVMVATSNVAPEDQYKDGLNRALFLPFVDLLRQKVEVVTLNAQKDYRLEKLSGTQLYFVPADEVAAQGMQALWQQLTGVAEGEPAELHVKGRLVAVPQAHRGCARFAFDEICERELGASDYLAMARSYHTLFISGVPILGRERKSPTRRFINLIDVLYDNRIKLVMSAAAQPDALYDGTDQAFVFQRTASRLMEMRSEDYLAGRNMQEPTTRVGS